MTKAEKVKHLFETMKSYASKFVAVENVQINFKDMKLNDGTTVVRFPNDVIAKGDAVTVITEQGELPLPDNTPENPLYTLEDGSTFTIVNGTVDVYTEAETPAEDKAEGGVEEPTETVAPAMEAKPQTKEPKRVIKSQVEEHVFNEFKKSVEEMFLSVKEELQKLNVDTTSLTEKFNAQFVITKELAETVNMIAESPATESAEKQKVKITKKAYNEMTNFEKLKYNRGEY
jgi:hypothetical protein